MTTVLVLGAGGSAGANFSDALRRAGGYRLVGADCSPVHLHLAEAEERVVLPPAADERYAGALGDAIARFDVDVAHPQPEAEVVALSALRDVLPVATLLPDPAVLALAGDKARCAVALAAGGVAVPEARRFDARTDVRAEVDDLLERHERVWLRARRGAGSRAALPVRSGEQATAWIAWWTAERGMQATDFMASELLPGREFAYQSLWLDGGLAVGQARERVEYLYGHLTPSGQTSTPAVARTVREPVVDRVACAAVLALDPRPHGVYCVDLKEAADGTPRVTEVNAGRFFTTSNFFAAAGLNMPDLYVRAALGERPAPLGSSPLEPDLYWIRMVDMGYRLVPGASLHAWPTVRR